MRWRGMLKVWVAVAVLVAGGCGRYGRGGSDDDKPMRVGGDIDVPSVVPTATFDRPPSPTETTAAAGTTSPPAVGDTVAPPASIAGPTNPCAGKSTLAGDDNVAERTDASGLVLRITVSPTLCFGTVDAITVALDVANRGREVRYYSSRRPVVVVFTDKDQKIIWSSCTVGRAVPGGPPDVPIEMAPGEDARISVITYKPSDRQCGTVPVGIHTAVASLLTCTAADAADRACDEKALVAVPSPGLRFEVR